MSTHSFPDPIFESLLDRLARALEVTQKAESTNDPRVRQELFQTVRPHATFVLSRIDEQSPDNRFQGRIEQGQRDS